MKKIVISIIAIMLNYLTYAQLTPMSIGTIEAGDSIMIYYSVKINDPLPNGTTQISSQGAISGSNISASNTDDPDTGPLNDATITTVLANQQPAFTSGTSTSISVCQSSVNNALNSLLAVSDADNGQTLTWSVITSPTKGTANGFPATATSTGGSVTPAGLSYSNNGTIGADLIVVQVSDGQATAQITVNITINANPVPAITGGTSFCAGGSTTLDAGAGYSLYNWSTGATTQTINVNTATTVTVTVTNGNGCIGSDNETTTVNPNPTPSISGNTTICPGGSTTLDAGAGYSLYNWSTGATTQTINVNTATTVTVTVTDGNGCSGSTSATTIVSAPAAAVISAGGPVSFCSGGSVTLTASSNSVQDLSFTTVNTGTLGTDQWQTFVPTMNGLTTSIQVYVNGTQSVSGTLSIYSGTGTGGTLIHSQPYSGNYSSGFAAFNLPGLNLTAGNTYTFRFQGTNFSFVANNSGYGTYFSSSYGFPSWRLDFKTFVSPALGNLQWYESGNSIGGATSTTYVATTAGSYTVQNTVNSCPSAQSNTISVTVNPLPTPAISGSTAFCAGGSTTLNAGAGYSLYNWSTGATTQTINVNTATTVTVTVTDGNGCNGSDNETTTINPNPAPVITGATSFCTGGSTTLDAGSGYSLYNWSTGATTQTINVNTATTVTVTVTDGNGCTGMDSETTTITAGSTSPTSVSSNAILNNVCAGNTISLTQVGGSLSSGAGYVWYETGCGSGSSVGTGSSITLTPAAGSHTYFVRAEGGSCGNSGCASVTVIVSTSPPASTVQITSAPTDGCVGNTATVSVNAVSNAVWYRFTGSNVLFNGNPSPYDSPTPSVTATFSALPAGGGSGWSICVFPANACGNGNTVCKWVRATVSQPALITGSAVGCPNTSGNAYSVPAVTGAASYVWTSSTPNMVVTGTGISVTVAFGAGFTTGNLCVKAQTSCGYQSTARCMTITKNPALPGAINGPTYVCPGASSSFSIPAVAGAATYNWSTSVPGAIVSPAGASVSILFPATIPAGSTVCVVAVSSCGNASAQRCKGIANGKPNTPANISGPAAGQCGQSGVSYTISPVALATGYSWTTSCGTISGPTNLSSVTINWPASFTTCNVSVTASNSCGTSGARTLAVTGKPNPPVSITGNAAPCSTTVEMYCANGAVGATNYLWTVPAGWSIIGPNNGACIQAMVGSSAGNITAKASNTCGTSTANTLAVTVPCRFGQVEATGSPLNAEVYPNPANEKATLRFNSPTTSDYSLILMDVVGQNVLSITGKATEGINFIELNLNAFAKGVYSLSILNGGTSEQVRIVVE